MKWFGLPWPSPGQRAPVCADDADQVPVPEGRACIQCGEVFGHLDSGLMVPLLDGEEWSASPWHLECMLYNVLGPNEG